MPIISKCLSVLNSPNRWDLVMMPYSMHAIIDVSNRQPLYVAIFWKSIGSGTRKLGIVDSTVLDLKKLVENNLYINVSSFTLLRLIAYNRWIIILYRALYCWQLLMTIKNDDLKERRKKITHPRKRNRWHTIFQTSGWLKIGSRRRCPCPSLRLLKIVSSTILLFVSCLASAGDFLECNTLRARPSRVKKEIINEPTIQEIKLTSNPFSVKGGLN